MKQNLDDFVTVVIPLHDKEKTIGRTLESVLKFSSVHEVIVVNDASTDLSESVVREFKRKDKRITLVNKAFHNVSCARNVGYSLARDGIVIFLDADDYWIADVARMVVDLKRQYPTVLQFGVGHRILNTGVMPIAITALESEISHPARLVSFQQYWDVPSCYRVTSSSVAFCKANADSQILFDRRLKFGEDLELWIRSSKRGSFCVSPCPGVMIDRSSATNHAFDKGTEEDWNLFKYVVREAFLDQRDWKVFWDRKMAHEATRALVRLHPREFIWFWQHVSNWSRVGMFARLFRKVPYYFYTSIRRQK